MTPQRVRVVLPYKEGYLLERLSNPQWPVNFGRTRHVGGGIELNEAPEEAASREMLEELGVEIAPASFKRLGTYENQLYLVLEEHNLDPGVYKASVGSDPYIHLVYANFDKDYMGPSLDLLEK